MKKGTKELLRLLGSMAFDISKLYLNQSPPHFQGQAKTDPRLASIVF
jgi:hypothetical protein